MARRGKVDARLCTIRKNGSRACNAHIPYLILRRSGGGGRRFSGTGWRRMEKDGEGGRRRDSRSAGLRGHGATGLRGEGRAPSVVTGGHSASPLRGLRGGAVGATDGHAMAGDDESTHPHSLLHSVPLKNSPAKECIDARGPKVKSDSIPVAIGMGRTRMSSSPSPQLLEPSSPISPISPTSRYFPTLGRKVRTHLLPASACFCLLLPASPCFCLLLPPLDPFL
jgi:hypothetical protein